MFSENKKSTRCVSGQPVSAFHLDDSTICTIGQDYNNKDGPLCQDIDDKIILDIQNKKSYSSYVSSLFAYLEKGQRSANILGCGSFLSIAHKELQKDSNIFDPKGFLYRANFCKDRFCPVCQKRRFVKLSSRMYRVSKKLFDSKYRFLFLTLTYPNCTADKLRYTIDLLSKSISAFMRLPKIKQVFRGTLKTFEITYNKMTDTFHPHFHILVAVNSDYFCGRNYLSHADFLALWRTATNNDTITQVNIKAVKINEKCGSDDGFNNDIFKSVLEVTKYSIKSFEYISFDVDNDIYLLRIYNKALYHRRMYSLSGVFRKAYQDIFNEPSDSIDNVDINSDDVDLIQNCRYLVARYMYQIDKYIPNGYDIIELAKKPVSDSSDIYFQDLYNNE